MADIKPTRSEPILLKAQKSEMISGSQKSEDFCGKALMENKRGAIQKRIAHRK
jgi:hypothetical protein